MFLLGIYPDLYPAETENTLSSSSSPSSSYYSEKNGKKKKKYSIDTPTHAD